jgi:hypothetical protein
VKKLNDIDAQPLKGGCITSRDKALLPFGAFSLLQNVRNTHPGMIQRPGQRKLHTTADSTNKVLSLYQFRKTNTTEKHLYAQMSDGDVLEATNNPPAVTTGAFGSEVFDGSAGQIPASWGNIGDLMLFSNGKNQHQIYGGTLSPVERFIVFKGAAAIPDVPQGGEDYSDHVISASDGLVAILDSLPAIAAYGCVFFRTPVPCNAITVTVATGKANANAATLEVYYWKNDHTWAACSATDGTASGGATLAQSGAITWTAPSAIMPKYAFGSCGFWYQIRVSAALDSEVELSAVTFSSPWNPIVNVWDGATVYGVEAHVEGTSTWETYASGAVDLSELASGKKIYVAFSDPVEGIYIDPGGTPNATGTSLTSLKFWDGSAFTTVGTPTDGSVGMSQPGWITFPRCAAQPLQLHTSIYQAYWYEIIWGAAISADTLVSIQGMPYFDITELGNSYCNAIWKDRACYSFDRWGAYIYVSAKDAPLVLNGGDYGILKAGDGRANKIVAMRRFHNELMVWQQELGVEGGCITLFEGYSPVTFGKLVLSSKVGSMNNKCVAVVDGVLQATATDESIKTLAFSLSRYGVCVCDGMTVSIVSDDIQNYFDPTKPECIRYGYEQEMWLEHDTTFNVIRIGLVSGATATLPNVFPVFDLVTKTWSFDTPAQELSCITGIEPGSGQAPVVMIGGGVDDGTVYQLNYGTADVTEPIRELIRVILNYKARVLNLHEILVRFGARVAGSAVLSVYENERWKLTKQLTMIPERTSDTSRRHRFACDVTSDLMTVEISHSSGSETLNIYEIGLAVQIWGPR